MNRMIWILWLQIGSTFPKLTICSKSMHSKAKMTKFYPDVTMAQLKELYGTRHSLKDKKKWSTAAMGKIRNHATASLNNNFEILILIFPDGNGGDDGRLQWHFRNWFEEICERNASHVLHLLLPVSACGLSALLEIDTVRQHLQNIYWIYRTCWKSMCCHWGQVSTIYGICVAFDPSDLILKHQSLLNASSVDEQLENT